MRIRTIASILSGIALAVMPVTAAHASVLGFRLQVTIPVICHITDAYAPNPASGEILLQTNCNAERYAIALGGDLSSMSIDGVSSSQGRIATFGSQLSIQSDRPGQNIIRVQMDGDLSQVRSAYFNIQAM